MPTKAVGNEDEVSFYISEYECRVIGNRLHRAAERYKKLFSNINCQLEQDCRYWAKSFLSACATREENDDEYYNNGRKRHPHSNYHVRINLSHFECRMIGNRLFEIGKHFEDKGYERVAAETKWQARRFHAEMKEQEK